MPEEHTVRQGDCISSIAKRYGHFWEKIWNDANNASLKELRKDPNVLYPGDKVYIPDKEQKTEDCATEQQHKFVKKGVPAKLRLRLLKDKEEGEQTELEAAGDNEGGDDFFSGGDPDNILEPKEQEPRKNVPYILEIDGENFSGQSDGDGNIEISIPENARKGKLILNPGTEEETIELNLGNVNPVTEISGVKQRLANLMLYQGAIKEEESLELEAALRQFQQMNDLEVTGQIDQMTQDKLVEVHGC